MYYLRNFIIAGSKLELVNYLKQRDKEFLMKNLKDITPLAATMACATGDEPFHLNELR